jgi:hypothetical protein
MKFLNKKIIYGAVGAAFILAAAFFIWQWFLQAPTEGDWQGPLAVQAHADFNGDQVTIKNIRNFRYKSEYDFDANYYDQTFDLNKISKIWYIVEPFENRNYAAHTFLSFEFSDGKFITISIEARKKKGQDYSLILGMFKTYPLMYIAADERDSIYMRTSVRQNEVYLYPAKATPEQARLLFVDMLLKMNELAEKPTWYNTFTANCTSAIADHINKIWPGRLPKFLWQAWITGYAEKMVFENGLIETDLNLQEARKKYFITNKSNGVGDAPDYSQKIREGFDLN